MKVKNKKVPKEITDYDNSETGSFISKKNKLSFQDLGLELPKQSPTQVVSLRLPTALLNEIKAFGSVMDVPYQALIKMFLSEAIKARKE